MALQLKNSYSITGGYAGEEQGVLSGTVPNWTNTTGGSYQTEFFYRDSLSANNANSTRCRIKVTDKISNVSYDCKTNSVSLTIETILNSVIRDSTKGSGAGNTCPFELSIYDRRGGTLKWHYRGSKVGLTGTLFNGNLVIRKENVTIGAGQTWSVGSSIYVVNWLTCSQSSIAYDYMNGGISIRNTYPLAPGTPSGQISCATLSPSQYRMAVSSVNYNCPAGNPCNNKSTIQLAKDSGFTQLIYSTSNATTSGTYTVPSLTPNTRYYARIIITNGYNCTGVTNTLTKTCQAVTLAANSLSKPTYVNNKRSTVLLSVDAGNNACSVSTTVYYREEGTSAWLPATTTSNAGTTTINIRNIFQKGKTYEIQARTTNCAGTYTGNTVKLTLPADGVSGIINSGRAWIDTGDVTAKAQICYTIDGQPAPIEYHIEFRPVGGTAWESTPTKTSSKTNFQGCDQIDGLVQDTCYEFRTYQEAGDSHSYSQVYQLCTPRALPLECFICENLEYMTELICQVSKRLESGMKTIYANNDTKDLCDPYSMNPTFASIWSRVLRFYHAAGCLSCDLSTLNIGTGADNQVWTGEIGWNDIDTTVAEGSDNLVFSGVVFNYIQEFIHSVFHPLGVYKFYAENMADLNAQSGAVAGDTAVIGNKYYTYSGSSWGSGTAISHLDNFGIIAISKGKYAHTEYYWLGTKSNGNWNRLDTDTESIEAALDAFEAKKKPVLNASASSRYDMLVAPSSWSDSQIVAKANQNLKGNETIVFLTEDI